MSTVRFQNLVSLLGDMERKGWIIDSFPFTYNGVNTVVVVTRYKEGDHLPKEYAKIKVCFVLKSKVTESLRGWADFFEVHFENGSDFCKFWNIHNKGAKRDLFVDFAEVFAKHIPSTKIEHKTDEIERRILGGYAEGNDPLAVYCYDVRRNGRKQDGNLNKRSIENSNKARVLRPNLYSMYSDDQNLSFFFSRNPEEERTDEEIMIQKASR